MPGRTCHLTGRLCGPLQNLAIAMRVITRPDPDGATCSTCGAMVEPGEGLGFLNTTIADNNSSAVGLFSVGHNKLAQNGSNVETGAAFFNTVRATNNSSARVLQWELQHRHGK